MNSIFFLETVWQDVRYAVRTLGKNRIFTSVVIASLALGIGANTVIFSLIDAALLKLLPVRHPEQLIVFFGLLAFFNLYFPINVEVNGQGGAAKGQAVSGDYFSTLGVDTILGRTIDLHDEKTANAVAVLAYQYWRKRFALDPTIVGKHILINYSPFTIYRRDST